MEVHPSGQHFLSFSYFHGIHRLGPAISARTQNSPSNQESKEIAELRARDSEVRAHERAHVSAAGGTATGGAQFTYQRGPDGKLYAVGGEVQIDISRVPGDPEATIRKAKVIRAAALAPADPSPQDRAVAALATTLEAKAKQELQHQQAEERQGESEEDTSRTIDLFV